MATTGRKQVAPRTIAPSSWANTTWDQTVQCFANAADRDTQYPTPHDGALVYLADRDCYSHRTPTGWRDFPATSGGALDGGGDLVTNGVNDVAIPVGGRTGLLTVSGSIRIKGAGQNATAGIQNGGVYIGGSAVAATGTQASGGAFYPFAVTVPITTAHQAPTLHMTNGPAGVPSQFTDLYWSFIGN